MLTDALPSSLTTDTVRTEANTSLVHQLMLPHCHMAQSNTPIPILGPDDFLNERRKYSGTAITTHNRAGETSRVVPRINGGESSSSASSSTSNSNDRKQPPSQPPQEEHAESLLWAGASQVEIDIMECCDVGPPLKPVNESGEDDDDGGDDNNMEDGMEEGDDDEKEEEYVPNGCIARQMEGRFAALMARRCTSVSDRALALTVLERTIQRDASITRIDEQQQQQQRRNKRPRPDEASSSSTTVDGRGMAAGTASENNSNGHHIVQITNVNMDEDDDVPLSVLKQKALENNGSDLKEAQPVGSNVNVKGRDTKDESRMKNFLAAGGLMVLNHWLIDAFTPVSVPIVSSPVAAASFGSSKVATTTAATVGETSQTKDSSPNKVDKSRKSGGRSTNGANSGSSGSKSKQHTILPSSKIKTQLKPSPTGPILLPLLSILESMPFDKDLVTNTKINKQIRNLKKGLNAAIAKFERKLKRGTTDNDDDSSDSSDSSDDDEDEKQPSGTTGMTATTGGAIIRKRRMPRTLKELRHPMAGGLLVWQVRKAVDTLMQSWKEKVTACVKYEKQTGKSSGVGDYYVDLKALFRERYKEIVMKHQRGERASLGGLTLDPSNNNKKLHPSSKRGGKGIAGPSSSSTKLSAVPGTMDTRKRPPANGVQEMTEAQRRLREREADLKAAQKARLEAKQKMESYRKRLQEEKKRKADAQQQQQQQQASSLEGQQPTTAKRRRTEKAIKWKDEVIYPGSKRRESLIQVHVYEQELDMWEADTEIGGGGEGEGSGQSNLSAKERRMKRRRDKKRLYKDKFVKASNDDLNIDMTTDDNDAPLAEKESITATAARTSEKPVFSVEEDLLDEEEMFGLDSDDENDFHDQHGLV